MTSALLVRRNGHAFEVIEGPLQIGDAITKWKLAVNADVAAPAAPSVSDPVAIEVLELKTVRSHKLRGQEFCTTQMVAPAGEASADPAGAGDESQPDPTPADDQAPRGRRKN
jgi:hypothetical protein